MKFLALLFVIGCASAGFLDSLEKASDDVLVDFLVGMEKAPTLGDTLQTNEFAEEVEQVEDDIKTQLGKTLKETLDQVLQKIRDAVEHGRQVSKDLAEKAKEIAGKLKELGLDAGSKAKDLVDRIQEKARDWLRNLLEKLGIGKRSLGDFLGNLVGQFDIQSLLSKLKQKLAEKIDLEAIKTYIRTLFGEFSTIGRTLLESLKSKGVQALKDLIIRVLPSSLASDYSLKETWEDIKNFFKELSGKIGERFAKFSQWVKTTVKEGFEHAKDKVAQVKIIAREVIDHSKTMSKEAAREALEFFRPYKEDLGNLWDELKDTVKRVVVGSNDF